MNLLRETLLVLKKNGKKESDVEWVGSHDIWFTFEEFKKIANFEYDNSYGIEQVANDLLIVGKDWYLEREAYDGAEWWAFRTVPERPSQRLVKPQYLATVQAARKNGQRSKKTFLPSATLLHLNTSYVDEFVKIHSKKEEKL